MVIFHSYVKFFHRIIMTKNIETDLDGYHPISRLFPSLFRCCPRC
jgi:hypothetical protein